MLHGFPSGLTVSSFPVIFLFLILTRTDRAVRISPEDAEKAGIAHDQVKINQKHGGGFPANIEGFHHLHCLVGSTPERLPSVLTI